MCISALVCMAQCDLEDVDCAFTCGMLALDNQPFLDISQCMADIGCLPEYPDDGVCLAEDSQAIQVFESALTVIQCLSDCVAIGFCDCFSSPDFTVTVTVLIGICDYLFLVP